MLILGNYVLFMVLCFFMNKCDVVMVFWYLDILMLAFETLLEVIFYDIMKLKCCFVFRCFKYICLCGFYLFPCYKTSTEVKAFPL